MELLVTGIPSVLNLPTRALRSDPVPLGEARDLYLKSVAVFWLLSLFSFLFAGYRGVVFSEAVSGALRDGHCVTSIGEGFGQHCFGDVGFPFFSGASNPYDPSHLVAAETPLVLLIFEILRLLPYNLALVVHLTALVVPVVLVTRDASKRLPKFARLAVHFAGGIATIGFLHSFDRGNRTAWMLVTIYLVLKSSHQQNWRKVVLFGVLGSLIKWWGPLLFIPLIGARRVRMAFWGVAVSGLSHLGFMSLLPYGTLAERLSRHLEVIFDAGYANFISHNSVSTPAMVGRVACWIDSSTVCGLEGQLPMASIPAGRIGQLLIIAVLVLATLIALWRSRSQDPVALSLTGTLTFLAVPEAQAYNLVGASAVALFLFWWFTSRTSDSEVKGPLPNLYKSVTIRLFIGALVLSTVPLPWFSFRDVEIGLPIWIPGLEFFRVQFLVGLVWLPVFALVLVDQRRAGAVSTKSAFRERIRREDAKGSRWLPKLGR